MEITIGKYKTRDGHPARVLATDGGGFRPVLGAIMYQACHWSVEQWDERGRCNLHGGADPRDLVLTRRLWVSIFDAGDGKILLGPARETADEARAYARGTWALPAGSQTPQLIAVVPIEFAEGDGLEGGK